MTVVTSPQSVTSFANEIEAAANTLLLKEDVLVLPKAPLMIEGDVTESWNVLPSSRASQRTQNPIRAVVDPIMASYHKNKQQQEQGGGGGGGTEFISLALGDPTSSGNFEPCPVLQRDVSCALLSSTAGYVNALGTDEARLAIAEFHSSWSHPDDKDNKDRSSSLSSSLLLLQRPRRLPTVRVDPSQVIVASGASGALQLVLQALLDPGTYLLVPNPGFPLYQVICENLGAHVLPYDLLPDHQWQVDIHQVHRIVHEYRAQGKHIRAMLINNPSNPTGAVYSLDHLQDLVQLCQACRLPMVSDEIYGDLTYDPQRPFIPLANVVAAAASTSCWNTPGVPVITCSGIGKQFLVPGWRVGWAIFYDNVAGSLAHVQQGAQRLAQIVLGASHLAQTMSVQILKSTLQQEPDIMAWHQSMRKTLANNATSLVQALEQAPGVQVSPAQGAMYVMVTLHEHAFDFAASAVTGTSTATMTTTSTVTTLGEKFAMLLLQEEQVFVLPGSCFGMNNAIRIVFCAPAPVLERACQRIVQFCHRHYCFAVEQQQ